MKLSELIAKVGDGNIELQGLQESFVNANNGKRGATITFATHPHKVANLMTCIVTGDKTDFVGLVVWIPRNKLPVDLGW